MPYSLDQIRGEKDRRRIEIERADVALNADAIRARCSTLAGFVREAWHVLEPEQPYVHNWHIDLIAAHLEAITYGRLLKLGRWNRLQINVPPGSMKSLMVSVFMQAWEWGPCNMPGLRYLSTSYNEDWVRRDTRKTRDLIESDWYQHLWGDRVRLTRRGETSFGNTAQGTREGVPFRSLTAGRADRVFIDDPHSVVTAESDAERGETIRVFRASAQNRLVDPIRSAILLIMQRLHPSDCSGVQEELNLGYLKIMLPMEFEPERKFVSPLPRANGGTATFWEDPRSKEGELFFPERFPASVVRRMKNEMGSRDAAGQLQQRPSPRGGLLFKRHWFRIVGAAPAGTHWVRGWDLAATEKKTKDTTTGPAWTAGVKLGRGPDQKFYIGNVVRTREEGDGVKRMVRNTAEQDGKQVEIDLPQDPGQAGKVQARDMIAALAGYNAFASPETGDKETRATPLAAQAEAGNVSIVAVVDANGNLPPWIAALLDEIEQFPASKYKDQVDALSRAFARLTRRAKVPVVGAVIVSAGTRAIPGQ